MKRIITTLALFLLCSLPALCAGEIQTTYTPGKVLYADILNASGQVWSGSNWQTATPANLSADAITLSQVGATAAYVASFPVSITVAGNYQTVLYVQSGSNPTAGDAYYGASQIVWSGTAQVTNSSSSPLALTLAKSGGSVVLTWAADPLATAYDVERTVGAGGVGTTYTVIARVAAPTRTYTDTSEPTGTVRYHILPVH